MTGKFTVDELAEHVFSHTGAASDAVRVGPQAGEDSAAIDVGGETLVVSADPISLAAERIGSLGVAIASNDVAASGGVPEWLMSTILLPSHDPDLLGRISDQIDEAARELGIAIVGGHTESVAGLPRPLVSMTCMGLADRFVPTDGANPGDRIVLTKGAGIEATAVLATDFREELRAAGVGDDVLARASDFFDDVSVVPESRLLSPVATAMHDPTEGGFLCGLVEMAVASDVVVECRDVHVREETRELCAAMDVDPLRTLGSGGLLAAVPAGDVDDVLAELESGGIDADVVGVAHESDGKPGVDLEDERYASPTPDDMWDLWE